MNILLINHYAGSKNHGMEYRPYYLASEWVKMGHKVTIVAASFSHLRSKEPVVAGDINEEIIEGIRYVWLKTPSYQGNGIWRVFNMLTFIKKLFWYHKKITYTLKPDLVIASSTYPLDIYPAAFIAHKFKAKLIFEVHDLWPLSPIELGGMSPFHPFIIIMQIAENFAYRKADRVVSLLPKADVHMRQHGMDQSKFVYIPNGFFLEEWQNITISIPEEHQQILSNLKNQNQFLVCYAGAHGLANSLGCFIEAASLLKDLPVTFVLVGQGPEKETLQKKKNDLGLNNVVFLSPVSKSSVPVLLDLMDALYIGLKDEPLFRFGISPNKLLDYMMAAKPIVFAIKAGNDMVDEAGCGFSVPSENPEAIANAIKNLLSMSLSERKEMGLKGQKYVRKNHDYRILAEKFIGIMQ